MKTLICPLCYLSLKYNTETISCTSFTDSFNVSGAYQSQSHYTYYLYGIRELIIINKFKIYNDNGDNTCMIYYCNARPTLLYKGVIIPINKLKDKIQLLTVLI